MNVKGLIIFIYILNEGNLMCHVSYGGPTVGVFYCRCVTVILANMQSTNKLPEAA